MLKNNKSKIKSFLLLLTLIFSLLLIIFLVKNNFFYYNKVNRIENVKKFKSVEGERAIGWIRVQGTNIDLPIVDYNLVDVSDPTYNLAWNNDGINNLEDRTMIYSHNVKNVSSKPLIAAKDHERFEQLLSFVYYDFVKKNKYIEYTVGGANYLFKIYAVYFIDEENKFGFEGELTDSEKMQYIKKSKNKSFFDFDIDVDKSDNILTLATCTRFFDGSKNYSFIVDARQVRKEEVIKNYKVKENKKYKKIRKKLEGDDENE